MRFVLLLIVTTGDGCTIVNTDGGKQPPGDDHTEWDCSCAVNVLTSYSSYYTTQTINGLTFCLKPAQANSDVDDAVAQCVDDLKGQGLNGTCTCTCADTKSPCTPTTPTS